MIQGLQSSHMETYDCTSFRKVTETHARICIHSSLSIPNDTYVSVPCICHKLFIMNFIGLKVLFVNFDKCVFIVFQITMQKLPISFVCLDLFRNNNVQQLEKLDAVLDAGGVYDPTQERYDHHQKGFSEVFGHAFSTKLSSAGLVYKVIYFMCTNLSVYTNEKE